MLLSRRRRPSWERRLEPGSRLRRGIAAYPAKASVQRRTCGVESPRSPSPTGGRVPGRAPAVGSEPPGSGGRTSNRESASLSGAATELRPDLVATSAPRNGAVRLGNAAKEACGQQRVSNELAIRRIVLWPHTALPSASCAAADLRLPPEQPRKTPSPGPRRL